MKKIVLFIFSLLLIPMFVKAAGGITLDKNSLEIVEGSSETFTVTAVNSAGRIKIQSADETIATVSQSDVWMEHTSGDDPNESQVITITVNGLKEGTTTISVIINAATFDEEEISRTETINVTVSKYSINYTLNGGTHSTSCATDANPTSAAYNQDVRICNPTKTGYTFKGWTSTTMGANATTGTAAAPTTAWTGSSTKNTYFRNLKELGTVTMIANYTAKKFTISYDGYEETKEVTYDSTYGELYSPTKEGHTFAGWFTENTFENEITATDIVKITQNTTLYPKFNINTYSLTINPNGGTFANSTSVNLEYHATLDVPNPVRDGYTFKKWTVSGAGSTLSNKVFTMGYANATLKASWTIIVPEIDESTGYSAVNGLLKGVTIGTDTTGLDLELDEKYTVKMFNNGGEEKTTGSIATGDKVRILLGNDLAVEYTVSVKGDVNGDGKITPLDYVKVKNHVMNDNLIVGAEYLDAADISEDENVSPLDYVKIKNYVMSH